MASRDSNVPKSPAWARSTSGPRRARAASGSTSANALDQPVLVEVVVRHEVDAGEALGLRQRVERDLRGEVVEQLGRRRTAGPVRERQDRRGCGRAVDHDVGPVTELVVGHEAQGEHRADSSGRPRYSTSQRLRK